MASVTDRPVGLPRRPADMVGFLRSPGGAKLLKYSAASVVSVVVSLACLGVFDGLLRWDPTLSSALATAIATVPSYELNRKWAWGKSGRGHLWRETVPFWGLAFLGLAVSTVAVDWAAGWTTRHHVSHAVHTLIVETVYLAAFGVLWVGKFMIFNRVLFAHRPEARAAAVGVPD